MGFLKGKRHRGLLDRVIASAMYSGRSVASGVHREVGTPLLMSQKSSVVEK
jgi:hypothetical protein